MVYFHTPAPDPLPEKEIRQWINTGYLIALTLGAVQPAPHGRQQYIYQDRVIRIRLTLTVSGRIEELHVTNLTGGIYTAGVYHIDEVSRHPMTEISKQGRWHRHMRVLASLVITQNDVPSIPIMVPPTIPQFNQN